jgi:hypothetical protein
MRLTARAKEDLTDFFYFQDTGRNSCCKLEHNHDCGPENMKLLLRKTIKLDFLAYLYTIIECQEAKISNPAFQIRKNKGLPHKIVYQNNHYLLNSELVTRVHFLLIFKMFVQFEKSARHLGRELEKQYC